MRKIFLFISIVFASVNVEAQIDYSGNYHFQFKVYVDRNSPLKPKRDEISQGRMGDLTLFKIDSVKYKFWLSTNRGWPSYNQGNIDGIIDVKDAKALYKGKQDYTDSSCIIVFHFYKSYIEVEQKSSDSQCGFGFNVYADGKYGKKANTKLKNAGLEDLYIDYTKYKILPNKTFLFEDSSGNKTKKQYFIKDDIVLGAIETENFVYVEFISRSGKFIYGWLKKSEIKAID